MNQNKLFSECQHGFRSHRSCITQLLEVMEDVTKAVENKEPIDMIYLDFKKAFDSVPHERLLTKLAAYGITGPILCWIRDFLSERKQRVRVGKCYSKKADFLSGVPQGSILGPILFTVFINDLPDCVQNICKVFADDTKIYGNPHKSDTLQEDLNKLQLWSETWNLYFNASKCKVLHIGKQNPEIDYTMKSNDEDIVISKCAEEKDLGVVFDKNLSFDNHIENAIKKANRVLSVIKRTFTYLDKEMFLNLYKALVRPLVEYGNTIWFPTLKRQSSALEKVQRRATKLVKEVNHLPYAARLSALDLPSLKSRRTRGDLIQTFKIINHFDDLDYTNFFTLSSVDKTRNANTKIFIEYCRTHKRKFCFSKRVPSLWNRLPNHIKMAQNVNIFKNLIDKHPIIKETKFEFDN